GCRHDRRGRAAWCVSWKNSVGWAKARGTKLAALEAVRARRAHAFLFRRVTPRGHGAIETHRTLIARCLRAFAHPANYRHTSSASSTIMASLAHCSFSASTLPSSVEAKPHCGLKAS